MQLLFLINPMENGRGNVHASMQENRLGKGLTRKFYGDRASESWAPKENNIRIRDIGKTDIG